MQDTQELTDISAAEAFEVKGFQAAVRRPRFVHAHQQVFTPRWLCEAMLPIAEHAFGFDGLVLDDWLRDPLTRPQSQDLLEIVDDRYDRKSTLVATQVPVAEWHARFPDPTIADAVLDRLVHNAYRLALKGESRRKTDSPLPMPTT